MINSKFYCPCGCPVNDQYQDCVKYGYSFVCPGCHTKYNVFSIGELQQVNRCLCGRIVENDYKQDRCPDCIADGESFPQLCQDMALPKYERIRIRFADILSTYGDVHRAKRSTQNYLENRMYPGIQYKQCLLDKVDALRAFIIKEIEKRGATIMEEKDGTFIYSKFGHKFYASVFY